MRWQINGDKFSIHGDLYQHSREDVIKMVDEYDSYFILWKHKLDYELYKRARKEKGSPLSKGDVIELPHGKTIKL